MMLKIVMFILGALVGTQVPGFIYQYQQQASKDLDEVMTSLGGFQRTANRFFDGDMNRLIDYYRNSPDRVFQADADSISEIYTRYADRYYAAADLQAMPWHKALNHILSERNSEIFESTWQNYRMTLYPTIESGAWAVGGGILFLLLSRFWLVLLLGFLGLIFGSLKRKPKAKSGEKSKESKGTDKGAEKKPS